jgi:ABC-type branched-subunit amino acid transport system ATPase component/ABC-type branched-subunit amino acid transport system permease subunit
VADVPIPLIGWHIGLSPFITGLLTGLCYAILAAGIVLIYRATKVINFAHGEVGAFGATLLAKMVLDWHWNYWLALPTVLVAGAAIGVIIDLAVVRRLFRAPRLILLVATIGVGQVAFLGRVELPRITTSGSYPTPLNRGVKVGSLYLHSQDFMVMAFVPAVIIGLTLFLTRTPFGIAIRASADNADRAELAGIRIRRVSTVVWAIGGALAVLTVVLINPLQGAIVGLPTASVGPDLLFRALVAALVGGLVSLPRAFIGGVAIGVLEAVFAANNAQPGLIDVVLFGIAIILVLRQGSVLDELGHGSWSLSPKVKAVPETLRGVWWVRRMSLLGFGAVLIVACVVPFILTSAAQTYSMTQVLVFAMVGLSVTVLAGWAGQLTLGQFAFVAVGALSATTIVAHGVSYPVACGYAAVAGGLGALIVGFPALRVRGPLLAITTLGLAVAAQAWLYFQPIFGTGPNYTLAPSTIFGFLNLRSERTFYYMCLVILMILVAAVSHLRSTGIGRTIIAVRDNQPAASSFGVSPTVTKLGVFVFSGALAGFAGALYAGATAQFQLTSINSPPIFAPDVSLLVLTMVVIGGIGSIPGAILGAVYVVGVPAIFGGSVAVNLATSGIGLLLLLLYFPGGLMQPVYLARDTLLEFAATKRGDVSTSSAGVGVAAIPSRRSTPPVEAADLALVVDKVTVRFGGRVALNGASIEAASGEVIGLIGSNGAGKSTLMNVISGFVTPTSGRIVLHGVDVTHAAAHRRAAVGMGRVFQDARMFGDLTLRETVKVAMESHERSEFVPSLLSLPPSRRAERIKHSESDAYIDFLGLGRYADTYLSELSTGTRRIVEMSCLLAQGSRLLLRNEPTAGVAQRETEAFGPLIKRIQSELGATIVIIEHDIPLVMSISDRVYCFAAGEQIAHGLPDEVRSDPAVIAAYLGTDERAIQRSGVAAKKAQPARTKAAPQGA